MSPLNRTQLKNLVVGILDLIREEEGGFATKTKLLKLLYLADIESYRDTREGLTGFDWIFYHYGPWTPQYDELLQELESDDSIAITHGKRTDVDAQFIQSQTKGNLDRLPIKATTWLAIRRLAHLWADEPTGEILNYVYFYTEPMANAERNKKLDFSTVAPRAEVPLYRRTESTADKKELRAARQVFSKSHPRRQNPTVAFTPPVYDDAFFQAIRVLDEPE